MMRKAKGYKLSILAFAALVVAVSDVFRKWFTYAKKGMLIDETDPAGFHQRNELVWQSAKAVILPIGYLKWWTGSLEIIGGENVGAAVKRGKGVQIVGNHKAMPDAFLPQTAIRFLGYKKLAEDRIRAVIGMVFVNRRPIISRVLEGGHYIPIVPDRLLEKEFLRTLTTEQRRSHLSHSKRINSVAFSLIGEFLNQRYWTLLFPEGTRVKGPGMKEVHPGVASALRHTGTDILPVALIGTDDIWKPGSWRPRPLAKVKVIFGEPYSSEEAEFRAREMSCQYSISEDRALCDLVMGSIAELMIKNGHPEYTGYYGKPRDERFAN